jgi:hypothetical protein
MTMKKLSNRSTAPRLITPNFVDATCATIAKGGTVSELALLLAGYTRAQIDELYAAVKRRIPVCNGGVGIREVEGVPVYGAVEWRTPRDLPRERALSGREKELYAVAGRGISVSFFNLRVGRYIELPELMAEIAAAKGLLAA